MLFVGIDELHAASSIEHPSIAANLVKPLIITINK